MRKIWSFKELKGLIAAPALSRLSSWGSSMNICEYLRHLRLATAGDPKCEGRRPKQIRIAGNGAVDKLQSQRDSREFPKAAGDKNVSQTMCGCFPLSSSGGEGGGEEVGYLHFVSAGGEGWFLSNAFDSLCASKTV